MPHYYIMDKSNHLAHYGQKGQQWGVRNYQNYDGTYTQAGLERYWPGSKHGTRGGGKLRGNTLNYESTWKPTQTVDTIGIHDAIARLTSDGKHRSYNGLVKELAKDPNVKNLTGIVDTDIKGYASAARKNDVNLEALLLASMRNKLRSAAGLAYSDLLPGNSDESDSLDNEMKIGFRKADEGSLIGDACVQAIKDRTRELLNRYDRANSEIDKELKKLNKSMSGLSEEDVRNDPAKEKLADKAFDDFVNSPIIKELADEYQYRYNKLAEMKGSKEYPKAYVKYMDDLSYEVATLLDHPRDATKAFNAGDGNFIDKESAVIEALHCANEAAYDGSTSRGGKTRGGMMTDMAEGISSGVVRLGERATDALRRTGERMVDKASAKDEEKRVKRELASLTRAEYGDPIENKPDAWTRIRSTDLNRQSVVQQLRQDIANGLSTADARKKYFDQMVKATLADRKLVGNKDAERQLREAWSSRTSPYGYSGLSSAARVREERKLDKQRDELQKMRSKVYDENYNIIDPALYKKYKAAKEQYKADKKSINDRVSRDVYSDYAASKR